MNEPEYLTTEEVASKFGVPIQTVRDWAERGQLNAQKIGARWFFPKVQFIKGVRCAICSTVINNIEIDFKDDLSRKEFYQSGLCQSCQDKSFKEEK